MTNDDNEIRRLAHKAIGRECLYGNHLATCDRIAYAIRTALAAEREQNARDVAEPRADARATDTPWQLFSVLGALIQARGYIARTLRTLPVSAWPDSVREMATKVDRAIGALLPGSMYHDAGAYARCSYCGRYSASPLSLGERFNLLCDCGKAHGWSGSFKPPGDDAVWSLTSEPAAPPAQPPSPSGTNQGSGAGEALRRAADMVLERADQWRGLEGYSVVRGAAENFAVMLRAVALDVTPPSSPASPTGETRGDPHFACPDCGPCIVDSDGLCVQCGADAPIVSPASAPGGAPGVETACGTRFPEAVEPSLRPDDERAALLPRLEVLADKLCQTTPYILGSLRDSGLTVVMLAGTTPAPSTETPTGGR